MKRRLTKKEIQPNQKKIICCVSLQMIRQRVSTCDEMKSVTEKMACVRGLFRELGHLQNMLREESQTVRSANIRAANERDEFQQVFLVNDNMSHFEVFKLEQPTFETRKHININWKPRKKTHTLEYTSNPSHTSSTVSMNINNKKQPHPRQQRPSTFVANGNFTIYLKIVYDMREAPKSL